MPENNNDVAGVDICDSMSICTKHPYKNTHTNLGGICAFCLQDKLAKLVSSSLPITAFPSSTDSTSNSLRSESTYNISNGNVNVMFSRSKSTATPSSKYLDGGKGKKRRIWSFWRLKGQNGSVSSLQRRAEEEEASPGSNSHVSSTTSFGRKVSRSRSVGCGSRRFSGDFFERISTGLSDCRLRRVQSQREGSKQVNAADSCVNERVRCGGIRQWLPSAGVEAHQIVNGKSRSWGWAFASPIRAFSKPSSEKWRSRSDKIVAAPNLSAMPSLLSVGSNRLTNN